VFSRQWRGGAQWHETASINRNACDGSATHCKGGTSGVILVSIQLAKVMRFYRAVPAAILFTLLACSHRTQVAPGLSWDAKSATFRWWAGEVKLPIGCTYYADQGTDTDQGHFTSTDGALIVRYDIGGYAGAYASHKGASLFKERLVDGARVWTAKREEPYRKDGHAVLVAVTFPDSGCANFFLRSSNPEDAAIIESVAKSFRPKGVWRVKSYPLCQADR